MKELEARLSLAIRYIADADAEAIVERQRERVAELTIEGCPTRDAENILDMFIGTLEILHDHAQRFREELNSSRT